MAFYLAAFVCSATLNTFLQNVLKHTVITPDTKLPVMGFQYVLLDDRPADLAARYQCDSFKIITPDAHYILVDYYNLVLAGLKNKAAWLIHQHLSELRLPAVDSRKLCELARLSPVFEPSSAFLVD